MTENVAKAYTGGRNQFDVSPKQRRILEDKAAKRLMYRNQYLMEIGNPYRHATGYGGYVFDEAMQRFITLKARPEDYFMWTPRRSAMIILSYCLPFFCTWYYFRSRKLKQLEMCKAGLISPEDKFKFK